MTEKKDKASGLSTCLENAHFAEMMQKMTGQQGIGSLCTEMMKKASSKNIGSCMACCSEMMQTMVKSGPGPKQKSGETNKEAHHAGDK